jgi:hypothetical protein
VVPIGLGTGSLPAQEKFLIFGDPPDVGSAFERETRLPARIAVVWIVTQWMVPVAASPSGAGPERGICKRP